MKQFESSLFRGVEIYYSGDEAGGAAMPEEHEADKQQRSINYQQFKAVAVARRGRGSRPKVVWGTRLRALDSNLRHHRLPPILDTKEDDQYHINVEELAKQIPNNRKNKDAWINKEFNEEKLFKKEVLLLEGVKAYLALSHEARWELGGEGGAPNNPPSETTILLELIMETYDQPETSEEPPPETI